MPVPQFSKLCSCATLVKMHALTLEYHPRLTHQYDQWTIIFSFSVRHIMHLRFWPHRRNCHVILYQRATFHPYQITRGGDMMSYQFSRWRPLSRNFTWGLAYHILSAYLKSRLRYNSFSFGKTNVRHGILLPVLI